eukprot:Skav206871  [mRNA]  locus=scaffold898:116794:117705:- [translate_table: standard]
MIFPGRVNIPGYAGVQDWQWNWGEDYTSDQFCNNMAFFVPFQGMTGMTGTGTGITGMTGMAGSSSMTTATEQEPSTGQEGAESSQSLPSIVQKIAKLQAENQKLMQLCQTERQMRQIQVTAFQQTLEMYAVPHSEVEQLVRRFQEDGPTALNYGDNAAQFGAYNANATGTGATGSAVSLENLLQDLYNKIYDPKEGSQENEKGDESRKEHKELGSSNTWPPPPVQNSPEEIEEVEKYLCHVESMVEMTVDERARTTLLNMDAENAMVALSKVEDIIREQGGYCRSLSSMVQSVCRKTGHSAKQ